MSIFPVKGLRLIFLCFLSVSYTHLPRYITGVDSELMDELKADHELVITLEDGVLDGGFGEKIARYYGATDMKVLNYGAKKEFVDLSLIHI